MKRWERYGRTRKHQRTRDRLAESLRKSRVLPKGRRYRRAIGRRGLFMGVLVFCLGFFFDDQSLRDSAFVGTMAGVIMWLALRFSPIHYRDLERRYRSDLREYKTAELRRGTDHLGRLKT